MFSPSSHLFIMLPISQDAKQNYSGKFSLTTGSLKQSAHFLNSHNVYTYDPWLFSKCGSETTNFKNAPSSVFSQTPERAVAISLLFPKIYFATLKRITRPWRNREESWQFLLLLDSLTHSNYSFSHKMWKCIFSHKKLWFVNCVFVRSVMSLLAAEFTITIPPPLDFLNHCLSIPWPSYYSKDLDAASIFKITLHFMRKNLSRAWQEDKH